MAAAKRDPRGVRERERGSSPEPPADPEARARQVCYRLLTLAPRTRAQLAEALARRGTPDEVAESVLGRFSDAGLIDDAAFAKSWVESRHHGRGLASRALRAELRQRGVADDEIHDALGELAPGQETETARRLVDSKLAATSGLPPEARIRRLAGMLARKGYPGGLAFRVIREAMEAEGYGDVVPEPDELARSMRCPRVTAGGPRAARRCSRRRRGRCHRRAGSRCRREAC